MYDFLKDMDNKGEAYVFDELYKHFNKKIYAFSFNSLKNKQETEGVVQEVFLCLWIGRYKLKDINDLDAWIFTITFNIIRKYYRKQASEKKYLRHIRENSPFDDDSMHRIIEYQDLIEKTEHIISQLPPQQRTVFLLNKKRGMSVTEISETLNISQKTVSNHLTRTRSFLRRTFLRKDVVFMICFDLLLNH